MDLGPIIRAGAILLVAGTVAVEAEGQETPTVRPIAPTAPLDSGEAIRISVMTLPNLKPPNSPAFVQVNEIRKDLSRRDPEKARDQANELIKWLTEQAEKAQGEAKTRTDADLVRLREFLRELDRPPSRAPEPPARPGVEAERSKDRRIDELEKEVERLRKELERLRRMPGH